MFKNIILASLSFLALACGPPQSKESIVIGMGLPLTGPRAEYGQSVRRGVELALEEVNTSGGIHGQPLEIDFQDDQTDPKQAVAVAQKFIANPRILLASEDGTVPSMAVSPLFQKAGLILFVNATANPHVTDIGDWIWCNSVPTPNRTLAQARYAKDLGLKKVAVLSINNDFGKVLSDSLMEALSQEGIGVALRETYLPDEKDFRSLISRIKTQNADGILLCSFLVDGSLLVQQIRSQGLIQPIVTDLALASAKFPRMAGHAAEGIHILGAFSADDPRPEVVNLIKKWKTRYPQHEIDQFAVHAYDSVILAAEALKLSNGTRDSVKEAFAQVKDVPSVVYGKVTFNPTTRRVESFSGTRLVIKDGQLVRYETIKSKE